MRYLALFLFSALIVTGCSIFKRKEAPSVTSIQQDQKDERTMKQFEKAGQLLAAEKYPQAAKLFETILVERPTTQFELIVYYNYAASLEGMGRCKAAGRKYRTVVRKAGDKQRRLQAQALLRLSYMYDCLGHNPQVISSLLDVRARKEYVPPEIAMAEVPARLAAAYARQGNLKEAERFFAEAEQGLSMINKTARATMQQKRLIAQTLYIMGRMDTTLVDLRSGESYMRSLRFLQPYLLRAAEMNLTPWSRRASEQVISAYKSVWDIVDRAKEEKGEKILETRERVELQRRTVQMALESLSYLKSLRFPEPTQSRLVGELFYKLEKEENRMSTFLAQSSEFMPLTPEAKGRQGLSRKGKVKSEESVLEKNFKKKKGQ